MNLAIDFDDTIHDTANTPHGRMGQPLPGAISSLRRIANRGDKIIIFTARDVQKPSVLKALEDWFEFWQIPYHHITNVKQPYMDVFIDNRALHFDSWPQTMMRLQKFDVPVHQHSGSLDKI